MAVDNSFIMRKIRNREDMYVAFCVYTNMPFVTCDPDTFNDQIWIFETEQLFRNFAASYTEKKIRLQAAKVLKQSFLPFYSTLYLIGVNELVYVNEGGTFHVDLEKVVPKPDYSKKKQPPLVNAALQLTGLYFGQEAGRPVPPEQKNLRDLQEELAADMVRARYIAAVEPGPGDEPLEQKIRSSNFRVILLKGSNGDVFQPLFTDMNECQKFLRGKKQAATLQLPFPALERILSKDAKGFMLNPAGFHLVMSRELLKQLAPQAAQNPAPAQV